MIQSDEFPVTETQLAAYLVQLGFILLIIRYEERPNGNRARGVFYFEDSPELREKVRIFNKGEAEANIVLYEHAKSSLLDRVLKGLP